MIRPMYFMDLNCMILMIKVLGHPNWWNCCSNLGELYIMSIANPYICYENLAQLSQKVSMLLNELNLSGLVE